MWRFIFAQTIILLIWVSLNITTWISRLDPYPFISLDLVVSFLASYTAPVIMMSQNRQDTKIRSETHTDYLINLKTEEEIRVILDNLDAQNNAIQLIYQKLSSIEDSIKN